jgi:PatG C-terminal
VIFTYTDRNTGVTDKAAVKVDVTEQFPFQASPLTPYYDR